MKVLEGSLGPTCFHYLFEDQASLTPDRPAVVCRGDLLTYADLNARANQIASFIRRRAGARQCVALLAERSADMIVGLMGILKAGCAYVPLLPGAPRARLAHQLAETAAPMVLTHASFERSIPATDALSVWSLDRRDTFADEPTTNPPRMSAPDDLAYVIYTSGSTGTPKGVAVRHDNLVNYTEFLAREVGREVITDAPSLSFATVSTLAADLGNTSIFPSLATGGCLHVIDAATSMDGHLFAAYMAVHPIDVLKITPSHLKALMAFQQSAHVLPRRFLITGGEAATWDLLDRAREKRGLAWMNHYGPTETTIGSLTYDVTSEVDSRRWAATVPIGRPIANTRAYVLDAQGRPVRDGLEGELYLAGRGVTAGYLNQPELTQQRFLDDPFARERGTTMYRTGDRVRQLPNGAIEFLGRVDDQVKIRGFRVELGEIEVVLRRRPDVHQTIVIAREDRPADVRLVAYVVPRTSRTGLERELRAAVAAELPSFMVPSSFVILEKLPLTANGKIDRSRLPAPAATTNERDDRVARVTHANELEHRIAVIWKDALGLDHVNRDSDFFALGGDSLKALHLLARIERRTGRRLTHAGFIRRPSIAGIMEALDDESEGQFSSLVPLQPYGTRPPLFCVHGGGGHCYHYRDLARRLGPDQPLWGLQGRHVDGRHTRQTRVEDMAAYYLEEVRRVAPHGPYYLAGASFGGKVAFEMAQMLLKRGEAVALLAMFDTWGPGYPQFRVGRARRALGWLYRRMEHHVGSVLMLDPKQRAPYLRAKAWKTCEEVRDFLKVTLATAGVERVRRAEPPIDEGFIALASRSYRPRFYPGKVILFRSRQQPLGIVKDRTLGWAGLAGDIEIHDVDGLHAAVVAEPRVKHLADKLRQCLERAQAMARRADVRIVIRNDRVPALAGR